MAYVLQWFIGIFIYNLFKLQGKVLTNISKIPVNS